MVTKKQKALADAAVEAYGKYLEAQKTHYNALHAANKALIAARKAGLTIDCNLDAPAAYVERKEIVSVYKLKH